MRWRQGTIRQATLATSGFERYSKPTRRELFLAEMDRVVPWNELCALIEPVVNAGGKMYRRAGAKLHHGRWQPFASVAFATLRARLLKIAARITETASRVRIAFAAACPEAALFASLARGFQPAGP